MKKLKIFFPYLKLDEQLFSEYWRPENMNHLWFILFFIRPNVSGLDGALCQQWTQIYNNKKLITSNKAKLKLMRNKMTIWTTEGENDRK